MVMFNNKINPRIVSELCVKSKQNTFKLKATLKNETNIFLAKFLSKIDNSSNLVFG
jgi:hypothetical protein